MDYKEELKELRDTLEYEQGKLKNDPWWSYSREFRSVECKKWKQLKKFATAFQMHEATKGVK